jgi:hypothetical protein
MPCTVNLDPVQMPDPSSHLLSFRGLPAAVGSPGAESIPAYVRSSTTYESAAQHISSISTAVAAMLAPWTARVHPKQFHRRYTLI